MIDICENPVGTEVEKYLAMAREGITEMERDMQADSENLKPYVKFSKELLKIYMELSKLRIPDMNDADVREIEKGEAELEKISIKADSLAKTQHITMAEKKRLNGTVKLK